MSTINPTKYKEENNTKDDDRGLNGEDNTEGSSRPLDPTKTKREDHSQDGNPATGIKPTHHSNTQAEGATQGGRTGHPTGRTIQKTKGGPPTPPGPRRKNRAK